MDPCLTCPSSVEAVDNVGFGLELGFRGFFIGEGFTWLGFKICPWEFWVVRVGCSVPSCLT